MDTSNYYTVREAAQKLNVSRQRVHQLIAIYGLATDSVLGLLTLIPKKELRKIPANRNTGTRVKKKLKKST